MRLSTDLATDFSNQTRARGAGYYMSGAVRMVNGSESDFEAPAQAARLARAPERGGRCSGRAAGELAGGPRIALRRGCTGQRGARLDREAHDARSEEGGRLEESAGAAHDPGDSLGFAGSA